MKNRKLSLYIILSIVSSIIVYSVITFILMTIRNDCFNAYEVCIGDVKYIHYKDSYYLEITDEEELAKLDQKISGEWFNDKEVVLKQPISFPYFEYWAPGILCNRLDYAADKEYIAITYVLSGEDKYFKRVIDIQR